MITGASRLKPLIAIAKEGSREKRSDLLREIADIFMAAPERFSTPEMQHFDVIMSRIAEQVEPALRQELAERLADAPIAPPTLMHLLAHDEIAVAEPVLKRFEGLTEDALLSIVRQRGAEHMRAIARRRKLPEKLAAALAACDDETVLVCLAENRSAKFSDASMEKMIAHARAMQTLQKPMIDRLDLPPNLLTKMYFFVSPALKQEILKRSDRLDPALIAEAIKVKRRKILLSAAQEVEPDVADARKFIQEKAAANEIDERLLNELMEAKRPAAFRFAFCYVIGVDVATANALLKDRTGQSLAIACRAAAFERATFAKILLDQHKPSAEQAKSLRIIDLYLKIPTDAAERLMRFWRVRPISSAAAAGGDTPLGRRPKLHEIGQRIAR